MMFSVTWENKTKTNGSKWVLCLIPFRAKFQHKSRFGSFYLTRT